MNCSRQEKLHGPVTEAVFSYLYPETLGLCLFGNFANLILYAQPFLRDSTTIRLLSVKAVANMLYMLALFPQLINILELGYASVGMKQFFWVSAGLFMATANTFGTVAAWITVLTSLEAYICVAFPIRSEDFSTMQNVYISSSIIFLLSSVLNLIFIVNRHVSQCFCTDKNCVNISYIDILKPSPRHHPLPDALNNSQTSNFVDDSSRADFYIFKFQSYNHQYDAAFYYISSIVAVFLPILLLICIAALLHRNLAKDSRPMTASNEQKKCVRRLTIATAATHLVLESPQIVTFVAAGLSGLVNMERRFWIMEFVGIANYLSMLNASISFFIYFAFSARFRTLTRYIYFGATCGCCPPLTERDVANLDQRNNRNNHRHRQGSDIPLTTTTRATQSSYEVMNNGEGTCGLSGNESVKSKRSWSADIPKFSVNYAVDSARIDDSAARPSFTGTHMTTVSLPRERKYDKQGNLAAGSLNSVLKSNATDGAMKNTVYTELQQMEVNL